MATHKGNIGRVLGYLQEYKKITSMQAFEMFGATRLSAIIFTLREEGYNILSVPKTSTNRYGEVVHFDEYTLLDDSICRLTRQQMISGVI